VSDDDPIIKEIFIDASPEETFPYLTETAKYVLWMGLAAEIEARPGGIFEVDPNGRDVIRGEFIEVSPPHRVVFTWGWKEPGHSVPAGSTTVEVELRPQGNGTLLRLIHRGLRGDRRDKHEAGWQHYLTRLNVVVCGRDPGPDRLAMPTYRHG
jgi:uncharacterized protein YndB with AHSA1/START domain